MGSFTKRQSDQTWLADIKPTYEAVFSIASQLNQALDEDSIQEQFDGVERVLNHFPLTMQSIKQVPDPSSVEARKAQKALKKALRYYINGAKQGRILFKDMPGGPGDRASNETGLARRAAVSRLVFSESAFREFTKTGRRELQKVSDYLMQTGPGNESFKETKARRVRDHG